MNLKTVLGRGRTTIRNSEVILVRSLRVKSSTVWSGNKTGDVCHDTTGVSVL